LESRKLLILLVELRGIEPVVRENLKLPGCTKELPSSSNVFSLVPAHAWTPPFLRARSSSNQLKHIWREISQYQNATDANYAASR
jgi:hypothetical protein